MTLSEELADYFARTPYDAIPDKVIERAKHVVLYHLGLAVRGVAENDFNGAQAIRIARRLGPGDGPATIVGSERGAMPIDAAFANTTQMRAFGLDDVLFPGGIHSGLVTIPNALAFAEEEGRGGREVLRALVLSYQIMGHLGSFTWSHDTPRRPTMAYGTLGAAVSTGIVLGLTRDQMVAALAYAVHSAQGLAENDRGPPTHFYALTSRAGATGAVAAQEGGWGSPSSMEGRFGFFDLFTNGERPDTTLLFSRLANEYSILGSVEKRYPGTALNIIPIELMRKMVCERGVNAANTREVRLMIPAERKNLEACHFTGPFTHEDLASSSSPYQIAMLLLDGEQNFRRYLEFDRPDMIAAVAKVKAMFVEDTSNIRWTRLEVELEDGRILAEEADSFEFSDMTPYDRWMQDSSAGLGVDIAEAVYERIMLMDGAERLDDILAPLRLARPQGDNQKGGERS
jgi:aconitate decarboxylase